MDSEISDFFFVDEYHHVLSDLVYAPSSVPGRGANLIDIESQLAGCKCCENEACMSSTSCQSTHVCEQNYSPDGLLLETKWGNAGVVECNTNCTCSSVTCANRVVQFGPRKNLEIFISSNNKGFGLRTLELVPQGGFICEYAGELIGRDEAINRFKIGSASSKMNYIFVLREIINSSEKTSVIETIVDPSVIGNIGRYINHSCDPNSGIVPVRIDSPVPRLGIFAKRPILPGEEISYDYSGGGTVFPHKNDSLSGKKPCFCGSTVCQGYIPFDESLQ